MTPFSVISRTRRSAGRPVCCQDRRNIVYQIVRHELGRREVHGDTQVLHPDERVPPALHLGARLAQDLAPDRDHEPGSLGQPDEVVGRDEAERRPIPACEGLDRDRLPCREVDDRLIVNRDLVALDGKRQRRDRLLPVLHPRMHLGLVGAVASLATLLRAVHRHVGVA